MIISVVFIFITDSSNADNTTRNTIVTNETVYILKEYNGQLAIYKSNESTPFKVYEIQINSLPEGDKNNLLKGIVVQDEKELNQLISDFTS